ncbi:MAG TPA: glycosyltransferase 87 family protein [Gaiellaceae bacterium]|nr:glycosyltransferase 87 family protein [Gaiellaceae bacterium]
MAVTAFTLGLVALIVTGAALAAALRLRGTAFVLGAYVLAWTEVVVLTEVLSLADAVGRGGYLAGEAVVLAAAIVAARLRGVSPSRPRVDLRVPMRPELALLAAIVLLAVAYEAFLVVTTPPNNYDSLTYHLTRAVAWLQQGHVGYFDATTARANAFPPNGEIGILYTLALLGRDSLAALPQLTAELAVLVAVHGLARRLGRSRSSALFAALLTATLSQVALQSVTTQNDLVVASFVAASLLFVVDGDRRLLPLAGLAAGLAVGTKLTGILALPVLGLAALALLPRRRTAELAAYAAAAFVLVGAFVYAENVARTGHVLGDVPEAEPYRAEPSVAGTASTAARVYWRFVDFSGLEPPAGLEDGLQRVGRNAFAALRVDPNPPGATVGHFSFAPETASSEDTSYFGLLGFLLVVPLSVGFLVAWIARRVSRRRALLAAALPLFVLAVAATQRFDLWLGRFMLIPVALTMPLAAWLYPRRLLATLAVALGGAGLVAVHVHNMAKPVGLSGTTPIWDLSRTEAQGWMAGPLARAVPAIDRRVPPDARLGVVVGSNDPVYLLYGPALGRRLVPLPAHGVARRARRQGLRWVVVHGTVPPAAGWCRDRLARGWQLLTDARPGPAPDPALVSGPRDGPCRGPSREAAG